MVSPEDRNIGTFVIAYLIFHFLGLQSASGVCCHQMDCDWPLQSRSLQFGVATICGGGLSTSAANHSVGWGSNGTMLNFYYSLLGAKISKGARISLKQMLLSTTW
jgi:hypothetical protein